MAVFYNQATLSYNGTVTTSNITTGEILEVLSASKNATPETYTTGDNVVFVVSMVNSGSTALNGITLTDDLGAYEVGEPAVTVVPLTYEEGTISYYVNGVLQPAPTVTSFSPLTVTGINIPADGNAAIIYSAAANQYAPLGEGTSVTNTAVLSGAGITDVSASEQITPENTPSLEISKSLSPVAVEENGALTYTFVIRNYGSEPAARTDDVIFTDTFDPILKNLTATFNGAPWTEGTNYTYNETTGEFTTLAGQITVPAAVFTQDTTTGVWSTQPGESIITISGNI
ncbi:MAG: hypothetical protein II729_04895 [Ruminococcus sp.]|nr:hypothetical protein [Ruminococcus sp.]